MARQAVGRLLIHLGRTADGVALLDEAMVAVTAGEVSPLFLGNVYCSVIEACKEMYDIRRAQEWTSSLSRWCASQPDMLPYRGNCLVFRAELMRLHGAWSDAMAEAIRAHDALRDLPEVGAALYQQGELHRLRGDLVRADEAFRAASATGHSSQPGLALLRLAQGNRGSARASIRRALDETPDPVHRAPLLPACVEISLAADDLAGARAAVVELAALTSRNPSAYLRGIAAHASAMVLLAEADAKAAIPALRAAWAAYREIDAPYESARVRELLGRAYRALGDEDAADMELDAARSVYERLDAVPDVTRLERGRAPAPAADIGLTSRELEVLGLVAKGRTNRQVADELVISEKTVARHISNIFDKLGLSSRSALTAYAYEHGLVARSG
jgi:DNA-binding NarL/FixJ family response regulator